MSRNHPSGRPIRHHERKQLTKPREVRDEMLSPGLRLPDVRTEAIGFFQPGDEYEDAE